MVYQDNHIITLNSTDGTKLNGTSKSNMNFAFTGLLKDDVNILRTYVTVLNAQIPVSFYVVDSTNNLIVIARTSPILVRNILIPVGNYNSSTLISAFATACVAQGFTDLTMSINSINGVLSFRSTIQNYTIYARNLGGNPNSQSTMADILGISANLTVSAGIATPAQFPLNLLGKTKLLINSKNLNNVAYTSFGLGFSTTIATVPVNVPPFSLIQFESAVEQQKNILVNRVLDNIDIQIYDVDNNFVNFNNVDWSLTIVLTIEKIDVDRIRVQDFNSFFQKTYGFPNLSLKEGEIKEGEIKAEPDRDLELLETPLKVGGD